jgi:ATP-dependent Clp protease ATP-binding subunit ClpC
MGEADFWTSPRRHRVLGRTEFMDRLERALQGARARIDELVAAGARRDAEPVRQLSSRTLLLELAVQAWERDEPQDAYLQVQAVHDPLGDGERACAFARELAAMYRGWASRRGIHWRSLRDGDAALAAVSGFGAHAVLSQEAGLHVLEAERPGERTVRVRVVVGPQPDQPARDGEEAAMAQAAIAAAATHVPPVVRRYRRGPSPEVCDRRRGWRTGRLDRVLAGDFDLFG